MSVSILEALQNADYNLQHVFTPMQVELAQAQVHNATILLEKGYPIDTQVEDVIEGYSSVEEVPSYNEE